MPSVRSTGIEFAINHTPSMTIVPSVHVSTDASRHVATTTTTGLIAGGDRSIHARPPHQRSVTPNAVRVGTTQDWRSPH
jgi:hypothetical protein